MDKFDQQQLICISDQDNQRLLSLALQRKNFNGFQRALASTGANPELVDSESYLSIFEKCCQTPDHSEFIKACVRWGCDVNKVNKNFNKRPINFAVESEDVDNIAALLYNPRNSVNLNNVYEDLTPLHRLCINLTDSNFEKIFKCIIELIDRQADVNIPNRRSMTPVLTVARKSMDTEKKLTVLRYFLENSNVDLDTYRNGEARSYLSQYFPELQLPSQIEDMDTTWDFYKLYTFLDNEDELGFLAGLEIFLKHVDNDDNRNNLFREVYSNETLLMLAARKGLVKAAEKLLRAGAMITINKAEKSVNEKYTMKSPIETACINGNWQVLELLLKCPDTDPNDGAILATTVKNLGEMGRSNRCNYQKCFNILLRHEKIDVNQKDLYGSTPLHYAVKYNNEAAILDLLDKGAYIGSLNKFKDFSITDIDSRTLEKHFDKCITTNGRRSGDDNYEIIFKYSNLVPARLSSENKTIKRSYDEMAPIEYMAKSIELKHLVKHPLIASFLFLKWFRLATIFYLNFVCYTTYCLALLCYLILCYGQETSKELAVITFTISAMGAIYILIRESIQLIMSPRVYLKNIENYLELALIIMTFVVLCGQNFTETTRRSVAAFTILLAIAEFFLLTGSLPIMSFSTHLVMLKTVSKSFLKSLLLYSIILLAFALCFYTLLSEDPAANKSPASDSSSSNEEEDEDEFNNFVHPGVSIIKTVVMLTGEFDASSINFNHNLSSYIIFLMFVFLISTVLFNLLNGLAVSDTQAIKNEAELMNFIYRAQLMARYEKILLGNSESKCCNFLLGKWSANLISVFPDFLPMHAIKVLPNANNQVNIPAINLKPEIDNVEDGGNPFFRDLDEAVKTPVCCLMGRCSRMEMKIVKYAKAVLENKEKNLEKDLEQMEINKRIVKIEKCIDEILRKINLVTEKLKSST